MSEADRAALGSGYLSEESKKRFTLVAGILGALFFVIQVIGPIVLMVPLMPLMMFQSTFTRYAVEQSTLYRGEVHVVETTMAFGEERRTAPGNRLLRVGREGLEEVVALEGWQPWLLGDGDRLWLISSERVALLDGGRLKPLDVPEPLGDISRPFLFEGAPAVVESRPEGARLMAWHERGWTEIQPDGIEGGTQALATRTGVVLLRRQGDTLYMKNPAEEAPRWAVVMSRPSSWCAFTKDGRPMVASLNSERGFRIIEYDGTRWVPAGSDPAGTAFLGELAVFQQRDSTSLIVVSQAFPGSLRVRTWRDGSFIDDRRLGRGSPFPRGMFLFMMLPQVGSMFLSLVLAAVLSQLMRTHRVCVYAYAGTEVAYASLTRRAISQIVDAVITGLPGILPFWWMFSDLERLLEAGPMFPVRLLALMGAGLAWMFLLVVVFSATEGRWGLTPGKWMVGIRVAGTDLRPCGFGRALIRNVLKFVDGFFNYLVGILMVAYTPEWQRLGDLAARTIVIRTTAPGGLRAVRPAGGGSPAA